MMCQCRFTNFNKCSLLVGDVDDAGRLCMCGGRKVYGKSLYLPLNFAMNSKLLLKNKVFKETQELAEVSLIH